jgi:hypothetical protein
MRDGRCYRHLSPNALFPPPNSPTHERESTGPLPSHPRHSITAAIRAQQSISQGMSYRLPAYSEACKEPEQLG